MSESQNQFIMNPDGKTPVDGFIPHIVEEVGYGIDTAIDTITGQTGLVPIPTKSVVGVSGQERIIDNPHCYAKIIKFEGDEEYTFYVRMNGRGDVSDPWGLYGDSAQNARIANHTGRPEWEFRRVRERAIMSFLKYLVTRNGAHLRACERDIRDA